MNRCRIIVRSWPVAEAHPANAGSRFRFAKLSFGHDDVSVAAEAT